MPQFSELYSSALRWSEICVPNCPKYRRNPINDRSSVRNDRLALLGGWVGSDRGRGEGRPGREVKTVNSLRVRSIVSRLKEFLYPHQIGPFSCPSVYHYNVSGRLTPRILLSHLVESIMTILVTLLQGLNVFLFTMVVSILDLSPRSSGSVRTDLRRRPDPRINETERARDDDGKERGEKQHVGHHGTNNRQKDDSN